MTHAIIRAAAAPGSSSSRTTARQRQQQLGPPAAAAGSSQGSSSRLRQQQQQLLSPAVRLLLALLLATLLGTSGARASAQQQQQQQQQQQTQTPAPAGSPSPSPPVRLTAYAPGTSPTRLAKNLTVRSRHSIPSSVSKATNISRTVDVTGSRDVRLTAPRVAVDFRGSNNTHMDMTDSDVFDVSDDEAYDVVGTGNSKVAAGEMDDLVSVFPNGTITRNVATGELPQQQPGAAAAAAAAAAGGGAAPAIIDPAPIPPTDMRTTWNVKAAFDVPSSIGSSVVLRDHTHVQDARGVVVEGADVRVASETSGNTGIFLHDSDLADVADNGGTTGLATGNAIVITGEVEAPGETGVHGGAAAAQHNKAEAEAEAEADAEATAEEAEETAQEHEDSAHKHGGGSERPAATAAAAVHARSYSNHAHAHAHDGQRGRPAAGAAGSLPQPTHVPKFAGRYGPSRRRPHGRRLLWRLLPGLSGDVQQHAAGAGAGSDGSGKVQQQQAADGRVAVQQTVQQHQQQLHGDDDEQGVALQLSLNITNAVDVDVSRSIDNTTGAALGSPRVRLALDAQGNRQVAANGSSLFSVVLPPSSGCTAASSTAGGRPRTRAALDGPDSDGAAAAGQQQAPPRGPVFQIVMTIINRVSVDARQTVSHSHNVSLAGASVDVTLSASNITQIEALNASIGNVLQASSSSAAAAAAAAGCGPHAQQQQPAGSSGGPQVPVLLPLPSKVVAAMATALHSLAARLTPALTVQLQHI